MGRASFKRAYMVGVNFEGADMYLANVRGADLTGTNLSYAQTLKKVVFDGDTILPFSIGEAYKLGMTKFVELP